MASKFTVAPVTGSIGAVIEGIDLNRKQSVADIEFVRQAWLDHGVVFMRAQDIAPDRFWEYLENFGTPLKDETTGTEQDTADLVMTADLSATRHSTAVWHADTTSLARPPVATALRVVQPPPYGGDTCWSSMYAAWEALSKPMQRMLDGLHSVHTVEMLYGRMKDYAPSFQSQYDPRHPPEQIHPVVLTHPETGRKALYVNEAFTSRIVELEPPESAAVLAILFRHVERPDFTMRWKWSPGDIAFWDNRCVQHYAVPDYSTARVVQRIVLQGVRPGEASSLQPRGTALAA